MTPRCPQILDNGQRCSALAINGSKFCRHHDPQRPPQPAKEESHESEPLKLPPLFDKPSILAALNEVVQALANGRIKHSVADTLLHAIKFAARLVTELDEAGLAVYPDEQPVGRHIAHSNRDEFAQTTNTAAPHPLGNQIVATQTARATDRDARSHFNNGSVALAASSIDPSTARIVKELLAQSHQLAGTQKVNS